MPRSREANAARMREQREAERHEASELHKPDVAAPSQQRVRSKRIAEASALALALEEEIAQSEIVLPEEREKQALAATVRETRNAIDREKPVRLSLTRSRRFNHRGDLRQEETPRRRRTRLFYRQVTGLK